MLPSDTILGHLFQPTEIVTLCRHLSFYSPSARMFWLPRLRCVDGFHRSACFVMLSLGFRSVCPVHDHFFLLITLFTGSWPILSQSSLFLVIFVKLKKSSLDKILRLLLIFIYITVVPNLKTPVHLGVVCYYFSVFSVP